jgi:hypothetical protein
LHEQGDWESVVSFFQKFLRTERGRPRVVANAERAKALNRDKTAQDSIFRHGSYQGLERREDQAWIAKLGIVDPYSDPDKWRKRPGCPPLEAGGAAIKRWHDDTFLDRGPKLFDDENDISLDDVDFTLPQGSDATDVLARMEKSERRLAGMIEAWESQKVTPKQSSKLAQVRREYRETSKSVIAAHKAILEMEQQKKVLVERETANEFVMAVLEEVLKFPRRIPARGQNQRNESQ